MQRLREATVQLLYPLISYDVLFGHDVTHGNVHLHGPLYLKSVGEWMGQQGTVFALAFVDGSDV